MTRTTHTWPRDGEDGYRHRPAELCADGNERTCARCGLIKVTVHPPRGFPWREWRTDKGKLWQGDATPPCLPQTAPAEVPAL